MPTPLLCQALAGILPLRDESVQCVVTSPPYWGLRDYQVGKTYGLGLEETPEEYVANLVWVFTEIRRVLREDGVVWLNLGDSYNNRCAARLSSHQTGLGFDSPGLRKSWVELKAEGRTRMAITSGQLKEKDLVGMPWRVAFALQADGWYLRSDIIWHKPNPMPESVTDRPTRSHEYLFLLTKRAKYFYDGDAIKEPLSASTMRAVARCQPRTDAMTNIVVNMSARGVTRTTEGLSLKTTAEKCKGEKRNRRSVWSITTQPYKGAHFATFPEKLVEPCILAGSAPFPPYWTVLDPFCGSGTTGVVCQRHERQFVGIDLSLPYLHLAQARIAVANGHP